MADLGTVTAHDFAGYLRSADVAWKTRTGPAHDFAGYLRRPPDSPPLYLADYANYPVRLNGRALPFAAIASTTDNEPWRTSPQPTTDENGRIYYHAHAIPIVWTAGAGAHTISIDVIHDYPTGPTPTLSLAARPELGLDAITDTATTDPDTPDTLTLSFTLPTQATLIFTFGNTNPLPLSSTTWNNIQTT
jgi:hypothetical protein